MKTGWICTAYFKGIDGKGTCDDKCQWYHKDGCPCGKGSKLWNGKNDTLKEDLKEMFIPKLKKLYMKYRKTAYKKFLEMISNDKEF
jgi:coenzyme F420-reducing hydrogenase delta subunit